MFVNSIRALRYADGVVSFELVLHDVRDKKKILDTVRIDIPYDNLVNVNGLLGQELKKIGQSHAAWLRFCADRMEGKLPPPALENKEKEIHRTKVADKKDERPKAGRLIKKV